MKPAKIQINKKCRKCDKDLDTTSIFLSRIKKQDWICKKCSARARRDRWWNDLTPEERSAVSKKANLKRLGLTQVDVDNLLIAQAFRCAICKGKLGEIKVINQFGSYDFVIDHDHKTKRVRGILCPHCNSILGYARDNVLFLEEAIKYLKKYE